MTEYSQGQAVVAVIETDDGGAQFVMSATEGDPFVYTLPAADHKTPIRFAVGVPGRRSTLWRLWANRAKDDVYLATRRSAGIFKFSLHESGDWRLQWVGQDRGDVTYKALMDPEPAGRILHKGYPSQCTSNRLSRCPPRPRG